MRFAFVGGADVPDWLLSQIFVVSRISAVKVKLLAKQVLGHARGAAPADEEKLAKLLGDKLEVHETKGVVATLHFILTSSARYDVGEETLANELQQLGLPREHTEALVAVLRDGRPGLREHLAATSLRMPRLESLRWRVHPADAEDEPSAPSVELLLGVRDQMRPTAAAGAEPPPLRPLGFRLNADTLTLLNAELRTAKEKLETVTSTSEKK